MTWIRFVVILSEAKDLNIMSANIVNRSVIIGYSISSSFREEPFFLTFHPIHDTMYSVIW